MRKPNFTPDDLLQPSNPRFKKVYGYDPIRQAKDKQREKRRQEEQRKADLEEKYWKTRKRRTYPGEYPEVADDPSMGVRGEDIKIVKRIVLNKEGY